MSYRVGFGLDIHKFDIINSVVGQKIKIGGVFIDSKYSLISHSDGDVLLHSITDAILGGIGFDGNIGVVFPNSDERFKNIDSRLFIDFALHEMSHKCFSIENLDIVIVSDYPKIMPYASAIRKSLSEILSISIDCIGLKATTTETYNLKTKKSLDSIIENTSHSELDDFMLANNLKITAQSVCLLKKESEGFFKSAKRIIQEILNITSRY